MEIKEAYLTAMREQAPEMFNELRKTGALDRHLQMKAAEAAQMLKQLTERLPKLPSGVVRDPAARRAAEEQVRAALIEFPPLNPQTDVDGETIPEPVTRSA